MSGRSLFRRVMCAFGACETFRTQSDDSGCWGECSLCCRRVGFISRDQLRRYGDAEIAAAVAKLNAADQPDCPKPAEAAIAAEPVNPLPKGTV